MSIETKLLNVVCLSQSSTIIIILFIVQCWTQASKPEPLKQDTQKEKNKINLYSKL